MVKIATAPPEELGKPAKLVSQFKSKGVVEVLIYEAKLPYSENSVQIFMIIQYFINVDLEYY